MAHRNTAKKREELKAVLIALEDTKSSKYYFNELIKDKKLTGQVIFAKHIGTDPMSVVNAIEAHLNNNPHIRYEKAWAVFDRDSWPKSNVNQAIAKARNLGICIGISNEAYELWILLHFERVERHTSRVDLNKKLNEHFLKRFGKEYSKSSQDVYRYIIGEQENAIRNAEYLVCMHLRNHGSLDPEKNNPLTLVYQLVGCLNSIYKVEKECDCYPLTKEKC